MSDALAAAIQQRDLAQAQQLLVEGADPNQMFEDGDRPLTLAAGLGEKRILRALVKAGANANLANAAGDVALVVAARAGDRVLCEYLGILTHPQARQQAEAILAEQPAPPTAQELVNALVAAALAGDLTEVERLLADGADARGICSERSHKGKTGLYAAARNGHGEVVARLIAAGSDLDHVVEVDDLWAGVERVCPKCETSFVAVQDYGQCPSCKHKFYGSSPDYDPNAPRPNLLAQAKVDESKPGIRTTKISPRAMVDHPEPVRPPQPWQRHTALMAAVKQNHLAVVQLLAQAGANLESRAYHNRSPLLLAVEAGFYKIAQCLVNAGAVLDRFEGCMAEEQTPLMIAIAQDDMPMVELLLEAGADVNTESEYGNSAMTLVAELGNEVMLERLQAAGGQCDQIDVIALCTASSQGDLERVKKLLAQGTDPNQMDFKYRLPLVRAASQGHSSVVQCLLESGAGVNGQRFNTPLGMATYFNRVEVVKQLIKAGADVNACSSMGIPLELAESYDYREVAELLRAAGAVESNEDEQVQGGRDVDF